MQSGGPVSNQIATDEGINIRNGYVWTLTNTGTSHRGFASCKDTTIVKSEIERLMNLAPQ